MTCIRLMHGCQSTLKLLLTAYSINLGGFLLNGKLRRAVTVPFVLGHSRAYSSSLSPSLVLGQISIQVHLETACMTGLDMLLAIQSAGSCSCHKLCSPKLSTWSVHRHSTVSRPWVRPHGGATICHPRPYNASSLEVLVRASLM